MPQLPSPPAAEEYLVVRVCHDPPPDGVLSHFDVGATIPSVEIDEADRPGLLATFGVNHLVGVAGTKDRTVTLSERSNICCPAHGFTLKPDACRSCAFLAGEVPPEPSPAPDPGA